MVPPWRLNQLLERVETGPITTERDFDLRILNKKLRSLIKEYDIKFNPEEIVPSDDSLADDLWKAAWDLYLDVGTLCLTNHRRVLFDESEIKEAMRFSSSEITVGTGMDARRMGKREIEDTRTPHCILSPDITCDEEMFMPYTIAYLQEPLADGVCAPILDTIEGIPIKSGSPMEVKGSIAHVMMFREAARRVGRPGLNLQSVGTAESDAAQIAVSNPEWGARTTDTRFVPTLSELKIDYSLLNKMVHFHQYGCSFPPVRLYTRHPGRPPLRGVLRWSRRNSHRGHRVTHHGPHGEPDLLDTLLPNPLQVLRKHLKGAPLGPQHYIPGPLQEHSLHLPFGGLH